MQGWEWLGTVGIICSIVFGYLGYQKGLRKDSKDSGNRAGVLQTDIKYIKDNIDKILEEQKLSNENFMRLNERVIRMDEQKVSCEVFNKLNEIVVRLEEKVTSHIVANK